MENIKDLKTYDEKGKITSHTVEISIKQEDELSSAVYSLYCANSIIKGTATKVERSTMDISRIRNRLEDAVDSINKELKKYKIEGK